MIAFEVADPDALDEAFWSLYDGAFPVEEREPREVIVEAARSGVGLVTRAHEGGVTVGLASAHRLQDPPALFLVYLAVAPELRGQGVGAKLFDFTCGKSSQVIWEVDRPDLAPSDGERARRERRIGFFRHTGGELLARPYLQPPLGDGLSPVPMHLMARPASDADAERLVRAIYFEKYGGQNHIATAVLEALLGK